MTWLEIIPRDVWLFRDGKPFSAGEDHTAHSIFPPTPLTVQGALRQKISMSLGVSLSQYKSGSTDNARKAIGFIGEHGNMTDLGAFNLRGPHLSLKTGTHLVPLFPSPADLVRNEKTGNFSILELNTSGLITDITANGEEELLFPDVLDQSENLPDHWITGDAFARYLTKREPPQPSDYHQKPSCGEPGLTSTARDAYQAGKRVWHKNLVYQTENRSGVSTNSATSFREEGQLFQVQFIRPTPGIGLLVSVSDDIPTEHLVGAMTIGGEQRHATVNLAEVQMPGVPANLTGRFKVILLTPAYFKDGWRPKNSDWSAIFGQPVTLKSAILYRPQKIGGWSNHRNRARTMHNYVAPGSVYYFETNETIPSPPAITESPDGMNSPALGFGQYAVSQW